MKPIKFLINKPWYMTAGDKFGWTGIYSTEGIGLKQSKLKGPDYTPVEIRDPGGTLYEASLGDLRKFGKDFFNVEFHRGVTLRVFPRSLFHITAGVQADTSSQLALL